MEQASLVASILTIIQAINGWDKTLILFILFVVPPALVSYAMVKVAKALISLRDEVKEEGKKANDRYENNVLLVESYKKLAGSLETLAGSLVKTVQDNTEAMTGLKDLIKYKLSRK